MSGICGAHLNLQHIVSTDAFVVHFMIGVVGVSSGLVFDKGKA